MDENICWRFRYDSQVTKGGEKNIQGDLGRLWQRLLSAVNGLPEESWDQRFNDVISKSFILEIPASFDANKETYTSKALSLLRRIGHRPHRMTDTFGQEDDPGMDASSSFDHRTLVLRVALAVATSEDGCLSTVSCLRDLLNILTGLMFPDEDDDAFADSLFDFTSLDVVAFLTSIWFQALKLYLWYVVAHHVTAGYDDEWNRFLVLEGNYELLRRTVAHKKSTIGIPRYMCNWAFRLLLYNRTSVALDFRQLFFRFREMHGEKEARCNKNDPCNPCTGLHPLSCGRFQDPSLVMPEQSVHTDTCIRRRCHRMKWDIRSYDALDGCARAVHFREEDRARTRVSYISGSDRTMAISHVWSHGHGGRPTKGMNRCLHERFSEIARREGCDSYWIDTLSIPEDHTRRREAIEHINDTFFRSKLVLIVDRDIMSMDIASACEEDGAMVPYTAQTIPIPLLESLIATFLVCDWNVRAWTMLEAVKGCGNLHLLCQRGNTLPLQGCIRRLVDGGSIDMATILLAAQHLLPVASGAREPPSRELDTAGAALIYRHATREGDDLVIWSLLTNQAPRATVAGFWESMVGRKLHTGFLVSTIRRLRGVAGFSWAPETPYMRWRHWDPWMGRIIYEELWNRRILPSDGSGSRLAEITESGLRGEWLFYRVRPEEDYTAAYGVRRPPEWDNPCLKIAACLTSWAPHVALIDAAAEETAKRYKGRPRSGMNESKPQGLAVLWSEDGEIWRWYGVYSWNHEVEPLVMEIKEIVIG